MELHRTPPLVTPRGDLVPVRRFAAVEYSDVVRELVASVKYHGDTRRAREIAELCAAVIADHVECDILSWVPTNATLRRTRGFDHAEIITRHVAAMCGLRARPVLRRTSTGRQTGRSREERLAGVSFVAHPCVRGRVVCLVDDVMTTGATMTAAAGALAEQRVAGVLCVVAARVR